MCGTLREHPRAHTRTRIHTRVPAHMRTHARTRAHPAARRRTHARARHAVLSLFKIAFGTKRKRISDESGTSRTKQELLKKESFKINHL